MESYSLTSNWFRIQQSGFLLSRWHHITQKLLSIGSLHFLELILKCIHHVKACGGLAPSYIAEILTTEELVCSLRVLQAVVGAFGIKTLHFLKNYLGRPGSEFVTIYEPAFI